MTLKLKETWAFIPWPGNTQVVANTRHRIEYDPKRGCSTIFRDGNAIATDRVLSHYWRSDTHKMCLAVIGESPWEEV